MLALAIAFKLSLSVGLYLSVMAIMETRAPMAAKGSILARIVLQKRERRHLYAVACLVVAIMQATLVPEAMGHLAYVRLPVLGVTVVAYATMSAVCGTDAWGRHRRAYGWQVAFGVVTLAYVVVVSVLPGMTGEGEGPVFLHLVAAATSLMLAGLLYLSAKEAPFGRSISATMPNRRFLG